MLHMLVCTRTITLTTKVGSIVGISKFKLAPRISINKIIDGFSTIKFSFAKHQNKFVHFGNNNLICNLHAAIMLPKYYETQNTRSMKVSNSAHNLEYQNHLENRIRIVFSF